MHGANRHRDGRWACLGMFIAMVLATLPVAVCRAATAPDATTPPRTHTQILQHALGAFDRATELAPKDPDGASTAYREAADGFEALIADGVRNGRLYYDLGNTYLQLGQLGKAIASYRRAEALIGKDASLQANLTFARSQCRSQIRADGGRAALRTALFWHYDTSLPARFWTALAAWVVFWALLAARSVTRAPGWGYAAAVTMAVWLAAGASTAVEWVQRERTPAGVTVADDIVVRKGNGEGYEPQFNEPLHEGVEFEVIDERPGWYKIELADGSTGWLKQSQAEVI